MVKTNLYGNLLRSMGVLAFCGASLTALQLQAETAKERLEEAASVFSEVMAIPENGIPQDLLEAAHCIVIVPGVKKAAFGIGGKYGKGFVICRNGNNAGWGAPASVRVEGGSVGWQIGGSETDMIMLVMNERGMERLLESKFTLGGSAEVAAGPVGRTSSAQTDAKMTAKILEWSRSRGVFAGVSLGGATLRNDLDSNEELYGKRMRNRDIVMKRIAPPTAASRLLGLLNKYSRHES
jgi:SH3 domain-containing YSC84-like protein 1